jgi:glycerol-3-phosphate dehydrogenase
VHDLAKRFGIDMPVTENVYMVLEGKRTVQEGLADLMGRTPKKEREDVL